MAIYDLVYGSGYRCKTGKATVWTGNQRATYERSGLTTFLEPSGSNRYLDMLDGRFQYPLPVPSSSWNPGVLEPVIWLDPNANGVLFSDESGTIPATTIVKKINGVSGLGYASGNVINSQAPRIDTETYNETALYFGGGATPFNNLNGLGSISNQNITIAIDLFSIGTSSADNAGYILNITDIYRLDILGARAIYHIQTSDVNTVFNLALNQSALGINNARKRIIIRSDVNDNQRLRLNGTDFTANEAGLRSSINALGLIGDYADGANYCGQFILREMLIFNKILSNSEVDTLDEYFSNRTIAANITIPLVIVDGNSISNGYGALPSQKWTVLAETSIGRDLVRIYNFASSSKQHSQMNDDASTLIDPWYSALRNKNIAIGWEGTNTLISASAIDGFNLFLTWIQGRKAVGFTVIAATMLPSNLYVGVGETKRLAYNQLIRDNAISEGYTVADVAAISNLSDYSNTTYYSDGTHLTAAGYAEVTNDPTYGFATTISLLL